MPEGIVEQAASKTCRNCQVSNLLEEVKLARCSRCNAIYCVHFASNVDPAYCVECLANVELHKEIVTKTYVHESYDEETDTVHTTEYKRRARSIKLEGLDWLFAQRKIVSMSDESLELAIEYHREILNAMLAEREDRKAKYMHRYAGIKPGTETVNVDTATTSSTTVKKVRTISSTKATATASAVMQSMLAQGMDAATLLQMLQQAQSGGKK